MENFSLWVADNLEILLGTGGVAALVTYLASKVTNKLFPALILTVKNVVVTVFAQGFGFSVEGAEQLMNKLPVITQLEEYAAQMAVQNQVKILEYEAKMVSPAYTDEEKAKFQEILDLMLGKANDAVVSGVSTLISNVKGTTPSQ